MGYAPCVQGGGPWAWAPPPGRPRRACGTARRERGRRLHGHKMEWLHYFSTPAAAARVALEVLPRARQRFREVGGLLRPGGPRRAVEAEPGLLAPPSLAPAAGRLAG